jgi:hypothetical protein
LYAKIRNGNPLDQAWRAEVGGNYFQRVQIQRRYPYLFRQEVNVFEGFAGFNKNIPTRLFDIDVKPQISFAKGNGIMNEIISLEENPTLQLQDNWQLLAQLEHEFDYLTSSKLGVGWEINLTYRLNNRPNTAFFFNVRADHRATVELKQHSLAGLSRTYLSMRLGMNF